MSQPSSIYDRTIALLSSALPASLGDEVADGNLTGWNASSLLLPARLTVPLEDLTEIARPAEHLAPSPHVLKVVPELVGDRAVQRLRSVASTYVRFTVHPAVSQPRFDILCCWYWAAWIIDDAFAPGRVSQSLIDHTIPRICGWERGTLTEAHHESELDRAQLPRINAAIKLMNIYHEQLPSCFPGEVRRMMQQRAEGHFCTYMSLNQKNIFEADDYVRWRLDNGGMRWVMCTMYEVQREASGACSSQAADLNDEAAIRTEAFASLIVSISNDLICIPLDQETGEENIVFVLERALSLSRVDAILMAMRWHNRLLRELVSLFDRQRVNAHLRAAAERIVLGTTAWHWQQPRYQRGKRYLEESLK